MGLLAILAPILGPIIGNVLDKAIPNKDDRAKATEEITEAIATYQRLVNKEIRDMQRAQGIAVKSNKVRTRFSS